MEKCKLHKTKAPLEKSRKVILKNKYSSNHLVND